MHPKLTTTPYLSQPGWESGAEKGRGGCDQLADYGDEERIVCTHAWKL
jgi:hypothetical protein